MTVPDQPLQAAGADADATRNVHPLPGVERAAPAELERNPGTELELERVREVRANLSAVERRTDRADG